MPWKETRVADERLQFIAEVLSCEATIADLCAALEYRGKLAISGRNGTRSVEPQDCGT